MPTTWDPANKNAAIALSGGNLIATSSAGSGSVNAGVIATTAIPAATKVYFEITFGGTGGQYFSIGVMNGSASLSANIGATNGAAFVKGLANSGINSTDYVNGSVGSVTPPNPSVGMVIRVAVDRASNLIWWGEGGAGWFDGHGGSPDPGTNLGGRSISVVTGTIYPAFSSAWTGDVATLNPGPTGFTYAIPSGYVGLGAVAASAAQARVMVLA